jgi:TolB protein
MQTLSSLIPILVVLALASPARAQETRIVLDANTKARRGLYPIAVPRPVASDPATAKLVTEVASFDLGVSSWFQVLDPRSFLADLDAEGLSIEPKAWKDVGAFGVIKARAVVQGGEVSLQFRLYEVEKGAVAVLQKDYKGPVDSARQLVHRFCNEVVLYYTGEKGFFGSQITYVAGKKGGQGVYLADFDGTATRAVTKNSSVNILPAFTRAGDKLAFTSYMRGNPDLYVVGAAGGRPKRLASYPGMNTGASFSPDGGKVAVTLSKDGNLEIYVLSTADGRVVSRLTNNRYIDTSPAWSPDGAEIAFVSSREGGPQIFVMNADGSHPRRVSTVGGFNQTPTWSPRPGARVIAYTTRDDGAGQFDIVTLDLATGQMVRVTQSQGNNKEPTWAPGGRVLAFVSSRAHGSGLYLANADGTGTPRLVVGGAVDSPDWGPAP